MYFYMYVFCRGDVNVLGVIPHHPYPLRSGTKQTFEPTFSAGRETSTRGSWSTEACFLTVNTRWAPYQGYNSIYRGYTPTPLPHL